MNEQYKEGVSYTRDHVPLAHQHTLSLAVFIQSKAGSSICIGLGINQHL